MDRQFEGIENEFEKLARRNIVKLGEGKEGEEFYKEIEGMQDKVKIRRKEMEIILKNGENNAKKKNSYED